MVRSVNSINTGGMESKDMTNEDDEVQAATLYAGCRHHVRQVVCSILRNR